MRGVPAVETPTRPPAPATGECHVWWARPGGAGAGLTGLLDPRERASHRRLARAADRRRYLSAHALARLVLSGYLGCHPASLQLTARCASCGGPHGKPRLVDPLSDLQFSLSHSGDRVVVAVARGAPVGVDVEDASKDRDPAGLLDLVLSASERPGLDRLPPSARAEGFLRYWTRKEAALKATGDGLTVPPARLTVSGPDEPARLLDWERPHPRAALVRLDDLRPGPGFVGCVAVVSAVPHRIVEHDGHSLLATARRTGPGEAAPSPGRRGRPQP